MRATYHYDQMWNIYNLISSETTGGLCQIRTKNKCILHVKCHCIFILIILNDFFLLPLTFRMCLCLYTHYGAMWDSFFCIYLPFCLSMTLDKREKKREIFIRFWLHSLRSYIWEMKFIVITLNCNLMSGWFK